MNGIVDTNVLMNNYDLSNYEKIYLPLTVIEEIDNLKNDSYKARRAFRQILKLNSENKIEIKMNCQHSLPVGLDNHKNDNKILSFTMDILTYDKNAILLTCDYGLYLKAKTKELNIPCELLIHEDKEKYNGFKIIQLNEYEQAEFYSDKTNKNNWDLFLNQYMIIKDKETGKIIDTVKWTDNGLKKVTRREFRSKTFGKVKTRDMFQSCAFDSLMKDKFTILTGNAGAAKSYLSFAYMFWALENSDYKQIYIIHNPVKIKDTMDLGSYSGNREEKLAQTNLFGILGTKVSMNIINKMIFDKQLILIPASDLRGMEIPNNSILYVTEAQNTTSYLLKTIIQRGAEKCKIIIEGDDKSQVDMKVFQHDSGLRSAIEAFKGDVDFSCVRLQNIYRSHICEVAERM